MGYVIISQDSGEEQEEEKFHTQSGCPIVEYFSDIAAEEVDTP